MWSSRVVPSVTFMCAQVITPFIIDMPVPICVLRRMMTLFVSDAKLILKNIHLFGSFDCCQVPTSPLVWQAIRRDKWMSSEG